MSVAVNPKTIYWQAFLNNRLGVIGLIIIFTYLLVAIGVWIGLWGTEWAAISEQFNAAPNPDHWLGTNAIGQDILERATFGTKVAFEVGFVVTLASTVLGAILGVIAGYYAGRWPDAMILWIKGVLDSIPFYLFVAALAYALQSAPFAMHFAMISVFWTTTARLVRAEVMLLKQQPFIEAAHSIGASLFSLMFKHLLPNCYHILLIQASLTFIAAIKTEVILSFLGIGIKNGISWGLMISEATGDIQAGYFYNFFVASTFLFVMVIAFNYFSDALQNALNPRRIS